jgi:hypothetical protein
MLRGPLRMGHSRGASSQRGRCLGNNAEAAHHGCTVHSARQRPVVHLMKSQARFGRHQCHQTTLIIMYWMWHLLQVDDGLLLKGVQLKGEAVGHARLQRPEPLLQVGHAAGHRPLRVARFPAGNRCNFCVHVRSPALCTLGA